MKYLKQFFVDKKGETALTLLLLLGQVIGTLLIPYLIAGIVDDGILKGDMGAIVRIGVQMFLVSIVSSAAALAGSYYSADLAAMFGRDMREKVFRKSQELSLREFDTIGVSSMITRTTSDISSIQQTLIMAIQLIIPAPIIMVAAIFMTASINLTLAYALIAFIVLFTLLAWVMLKKSNRLSRQIQIRLDHINQVIRESITGIRVIRAFGNEAYEENRSGHAFKQYADNMIKLNKLFAALNPAVWMIMGLSMAVIVWLGGYFSLKGTMAVGEITAVTEYTIMTLGYLIMAASSCVMLPKMRSCLDRLEEILAIQPEIRDPDKLSLRNETTVNKTAEHASTVLEFDRVSFNYPGADEPVIQNLSFSCDEGQTVAIIGGTGSGKSTIANLLLRLNDITSGQIRLDGTDIRSMPQEELRNAVGYVPQKAFLFSGTIASNLHMGNADASEIEMQKALHIAQADTFVNHLPKGLKAPVAQSGSNFSGGQKQRLAIARSLIRQSKVYVFDDSFSALDLKTDAALRKALKQHVTEAVKIIIAQRISTIIDADQILVIDEGKLVGIGKHDDLIRHCPVYQAIANSQMNRKEG